MCDDDDVGNATVSLKYMMTRVRVNNSISPLVRRIENTFLTLWLPDMFENKIYYGTRNQTANDVILVPSYC